MSIMPSAEPMLERLVSEFREVCVEGADPYRIWIPQDWLVARGADGGPPEVPGAMKLLGVFREPRAIAQAAFITVQMQRVPFEVSLDAWLLSEATTRGWTAFHQQWLDEPMRRIELGVTRREDGTSWVGRMHAFIDNARVVIVTAWAPRSRWDDLALQLSVPGVSCELVQATGVWKLERWTERAAPGMLLQLPSSWTSEAASTSVVDARLELQGETCALLRARCRRIPDTTRDETIFDSLRRDVRASGFLMARSMRRENDRFDRDVEGWLGSRNADVQLGEELGRAWLGAARRGDVLLDLVVLGPPVRVAPVLWMRAHRAFQIAGHTLDIKRR